MYYIYILSNDNNRVLYIGITNDLRRRVFEHKSEKIDGFTIEYHVHKLVYYEAYSDPIRAIEREKQLKKWTRIKKDNLIDKINPKREDLANKF